MSPCSARVSFPTCKNVILFLYVLRAFLCNVNATNEFPNRNNSSVRFDNRRRSTGRLVEYFEELLDVNNATIRVRARLKNSAGLFQGLDSLVSLMQAEGRLDNAQK